MPEDMRPEALVWGVAGTSAEQEEVFRFRYAHYYRNLPPAPGVDHAAGRVYLPVDQISTHLTGRYASGELVIVCTGTPASSGGLPQEWREILRLDLLSALNLERIPIIARLVEHETYRHSAVFPAFYKFSTQYFMDRGATYSIHYCAPALVSLYERVGYRIYGPGYTFSSGLFRIPMILAEASMPALPGPGFRPALRAGGSPTIADDLKSLHELIPETARAPLCALGAAERLQTLRSVLAANPGPKREHSIPDAAAKPLRRATLMELAVGDNPIHPVDQPLIWFVLSGEMALRGRDGSESEVLPGSFVNGYAAAACRALTRCRVVALTRGSAPESGQAVLPADFWHSL